MWLWWMKIPTENFTAVTLDHLIHRIHLINQIHEKLSSDKSYWVMKVVLW